MLHLFPHAVAPTIAESPLWRDPMSDEAYAMRKNLTDAEKGKTVVRPPRAPEGMLEVPSGGGSGQLPAFHQHLPLQGQGQDHSSSQRPHSYQATQSYEPQDFYSMTSTASHTAGVGHDSLRQGKGHGTSVYRHYDGDASYPTQQRSTMPSSQKADSAQKVYEPYATQSAAYGQNQSNASSAPYGIHQASPHQNKSDVSKDQYEGGRDDSDPLQYMS